MDATETAAGTTAAPEGTPKEGEGQQVEQQAPKYVTAEELATRLADQEKVILAKTKQSTSALIKNRIADYDKMVKVSEKSGTPIPPEAQEKAKQQIRIDAMTEEAEGVAATPEGQPGDQQAPTSDAAWREYVSNQIDAVMKAKGVELAPGDPEWAVFEKALKEEQDLSALILVTAEQAQAKKTRLASDKETAAARAGAGGNHAGEASMASAHKGWQNAYKK